MACKTIWIRNCLISYNISNIFDRVMSTLFQPRLLARLRVAMLFARVIIAPPSPIAPLETFGFLDATGDGLSRWLLYLSLNRFAVAELKRWSMSSEILCWRLLMMVGCGDCASSASVPSSASCSFSATCSSSSSGSCAAC